MKIKRTAIGSLLLFVGLSLGATLASAQNGPIHDHFDTRDRKIATEWYKAHPDAFKSEQGTNWRADWEPNLRDGFVLTADMRAAVHRAPTELETQFGPAPEGYRYVMLGDHILIIDNDYRIHDVMHFETKPIS